MEWRSRGRSAAFAFGVLVLERGAALLGERWLCRALRNELINKVEVEQPCCLLLACFRVLSRSAVEIRLGSEHPPRGASDSFWLGALGVAFTQMGPF